MYKNRKRIDVNWNKDLTIFLEDEISVIVGDTSISTEDAKEYSYKSGFLFSFSVVNPSPSDIAFFDLRAFSEENKNTALVTRQTMLKDYRKYPIYSSFDGELRELFIPDKKHGTLKANSYTRFDIIIIPEDHIKNILNVSIQFAMDSYFFKDKYSLRKKKYKSYGMEYDVRNWKKELLQLEQKRQQLEQKQEPQVHP